MCARHKARRQLARRTYKKNQLKKRKSRRKEKIDPEKFQVQKNIRRNKGGKAKENYRRKWSNILDHKKRGRRNKGGEATGKPLTSGRLVSELSSRREAPARSPNAHSSPTSK